RTHSAEAAALFTDGPSTDSGRPDGPAAREFYAIRRRCGALGSTTSRRGPPIERRLRVASVGCVDTDAMLTLLKDVADEVINPRFRALAAGEIHEKRPGDLV